MEAYQQRVVDEKKELDIKLDKLVEFLKSPKITSVNPDEHNRLTRQQYIMRQYSEVLSERIVHF